MQNFRQPSRIDPYFGIHLKGVGSSTMDYTSFVLGKDCSWPLWDQFDASAQVCGLPCTEGNYCKSHNHASKEFDE